MYYNYDDFYTSVRIKRFYSIEDIDTSRSGIANYLMRHLSYLHVEVNMNNNSIIYGTNIDFSLKALIYCYINSQHRIFLTCYKFGKQLKVVCGNFEIYRY